MSFDPVRVLNDRILDAMRAEFGAALPADADAQIRPSTNPKFGDFQANGVMSVGKALGLNPRDAAAKVCSRLNIDDIAEPPQVAGPGFINLTLKPAALVRALESMDSAALGVPVPADPETIVVDLCGVNLAKQMHVGHLRATIIGDTLARLHARLGAKVFRQNHFGDWGLPIAMVVMAVKDRVEREGLNPATLSLSEIEAVYREATRASKQGMGPLEIVNRHDLGPKAKAEWEVEAEPALAYRARVQAALVALQSGEAGMVRVWEAISATTLSACFQVCARLHANVTAQATAGESTFRHELAPLVEDLQRRGVAKVDDGAVVVPIDDMGIKEPCIIRKRDGGFLYATTDLCGVRKRVQKLGADRVLYAVDARQAFHFRQVFAASKKAGFTVNPRGREAVLFHAAFGTVLGDDGTPFKTRSGDNVKLSDLLDEAVERAAAAVAEKNPGLPEDERRRIAEAVGVSAIKYADLSNDRIKDYVFSFDRMLAFEGNTGPYLQYALVRVRSILRKARDEHGIDESSLTGVGLGVTQPEEKQMALQILKYPGVLRSAADACEPHRLCGYLYDLAGAFSSFFTNCPVLSAPDAPTRLSRLRLCRLVGAVLRDGMETLGLVPLERM